jgi:hypothetical protein
VLLPANGIECAQDAMLELAQLVANQCVLEDSGCVAAADSKVNPFVVTLSGLEVLPGAFKLALGVVETLFGLALSPKELVLTLIYRG